MRYWSPEPNCVVYSSHVWTQRSHPQHGKAACVSAYFVFGDQILQRRRDRAETTPTPETVDTQPWKPYNAASTAHNRFTATIAITNHLTNHLHSHPTISHPKPTNPKPILPNQNLNHAFPQIHPHPPGPQPPLHQRPRRLGAILQRRQLQRRLRRQSRHRQPLLPQPVRPPLDQIFGHHGARHRPRGFAGARLRLPELLRGEGAEKLHGVWTAEAFLL